MINYVHGDMFNSYAEALVNPVNTVGVMGKGLALRFKHAFPSNMERYASACKTGEVRVGHVFPVRLEEFGIKWIVNFPTKQHWRDPSRTEWIESGLKDLRKFIVYNKVKSIAIPKLGCGLGGLYWSDVRPIMEYHLRDLNDTDIKVYRGDK